MFNRLTYQTSDSLMGSPTWKSHGVSGNCLSLSAISLMTHFISSLRMALGVFPLLCVYLMKIFYLLGTHMSDGQEDDFS